MPKKRLDIKKEEPGFMLMMNIENRNRNKNTQFIFIVMLNICNLFFISYQKIFNAKVQLLSLVLMRTYCYQTRLHIKSTSSETHLSKIVHSNQQNE